MFPNPRPNSRLTLCAATVALATAFVVAPAALPFSGMDDAAYAQGKSGDKGNKGGNKGGGNKSGKENGFKGAGKDKGGKGNKGGNKSSGGGFGKTVSNLLNLGQSKKQARSTSSGASAATTSTAAVEAEVTSEATTELVAMHPKEKGRWNASPAQAAFDAQIRNAVRKGEFNGSTVATLAGYDLVLKYNEVAGAGEEAVTEGLSQTELDALDILRDRYGLDDGTPPEDVDSYLNEAYGSDMYDATFTYTESGGLDCSGDDCPDPKDEDDAQVLASIAEDAAMWEPPTEEEIAEAQEAAAGDLLDAYEMTIQTESNKTPSDWDQLYYNMADDLGYTHPDLIPEPVIEEEVSES